MKKTFIDLIEVSGESSIVEVSTSENIAGKTLKDLNLKALYGINIIALCRDHGGKTNIAQVAEDVIQVDDIIVAIGDNKHLKKLEWI